MYNASHCTNLDQLNSRVHFQINTYPLDSNLSVDTVIHPLKNQAQDYKSSAGLKNSLKDMQKHFVRGRKISLLEPSVCLDFTIVMTTEFSQIHMYTVAQFLILHEFLFFFCLSLEHLPSIQCQNIGQMQ